MRTARAVLRALSAGAMVLAAGGAVADVTAVGSFSEIPGAVYYEIDNPSPCGGHFREPFDVEVGGRTVTVTYYSELSVDHRYNIGCANYSSSTWNTWRVAPDPAVNPGNFIADYNTPLDGPGDLILNFSEPLTGFGTSSILGPFATSSRPNDKDTIVAYDGPNGTGNALATVSTPDIIHLQLRIGFAGVVADGPIIRSVRYLNQGPSFSVDGITLAVDAAAECDDIDFNNDEIFPDIQDLLDFLDVFAGGPCPTEPPAGNGCNDLDFNNDEIFPDQADLEKFLEVFGGGEC